MRKPLGLVPSLASLRHVASATVFGTALLLLTASCGDPNGPFGLGQNPSDPNNPNNPNNPQDPGSQPTFGTTSHGEGTYYGATGAGNCSYDATPNDLMVAAMNNPQYDNSSVCGMCAEVYCEDTRQGVCPQGAGNKIVVRIVDRCPECKTGDLDLSESAFAKLAEAKYGRIKIAWQPVACGVSGPLSYRFKEGSSQYWMAVQVRNSRYPVKKIEVQSGGSFMTLSQQSYNYFVQDSPAPGPGPFTFRVTSLNDKQITETGVALKDATTVPGSQQFQ